MHLHCQEYGLHLLATVSQERWTLWPCFGNCYTNRNLSIHQLSKARGTLIKNWPCHSKVPSEYFMTWAQPRNRWGKKNTNKPNAVFDQPHLKVWAQILFTSPSEKIFCTWNTRSGLAQSSITSIIAQMPFKNPRP